jgi:GNAT superfamily N-acetyltransferase
MSTFVPRVALVVGDARHLVEARQGGPDMAGIGQGFLALAGEGEYFFRQVVALRIEVMRESLQRIGRFDPARARERVRSGFAPAYTRHIELNGCRVGFVVVKPVEDYLLLDHLYIHLHFQGKGVGAAVLQKIFEEADTAKKALRVGALRGSDANRFYLKHGFGFVGESEWDIYYLRAPR